MRVRLRVPQRSRVRLNLESAFHPTLPRGDRDSLRSSISDGHDVNAVWLSPKRLSRSRRAPLLVLHEKCAATDAALENKGDTFWAPDTLRGCAKQTLCSMIAALPYQLW